ncbi:Tetraacyldisaccharide 4'-kinase [Imhoffiella purpurea]|uniref:Tetraacyldisaccharide 4'-kinase n=1 Tax=Imhoffiella purpurea TaxID=1249627 RepID=W9UXG4_9GAMM|nr:Tetraacyldisaccharide 4'-kinase [Imhoffiella purpurea]
MVVAGPDRVAAGRLALESEDCDILISDDGLQHYRLQRDLEVVLVDAERGFGNGRCLPSGPLREPTGRLESVDLVIYKAAAEAPEPAMRLVPGELVSLGHPESTRPLSALAGVRVCAVAGIGNPGPFFASLREAGLDPTERPYPDHHDFSAEEVAAWPHLPVIMTEKDAVKCAPYARGDHWYLPVEAELDASLLDDLLSKLAGPTHG